MKLFIGRKDNGGRGGHWLHFLPTSHSYGCYGLHEVLNSMQCQLSGSQT